MSVLALSSSSAYTPIASSAFTSTTNGASQILQDFNQLSQSLQSNNLSGAQSAFSSLQQALQNASPSSGGSQSASTGNSMLQTDFSDLASACHRAI